MVVFEVLVGKREWNSCSFVYKLLFVGSLEGAMKGEKIVRRKYQVVGLSHRASDAEVEG